MKSRAGFIFYPLSPGEGFFSLAAGGCVKSKIDHF